MLSVGGPNSRIIGVGAHGTNKPLQTKSEINAI